MSLQAEVNHLGVEIRSGHLDPGEEMRLRHLSDVISKAYDIFPVAATVELDLVDASDALEAETTPDSDPSAEV